MSLPHVVLGLLVEPASGYDLKKSFEATISHFWSAELAQIYPVLSRLEDRGLLHSTREESERGPPRKVYRRTEDGVRELQEWIESGPAELRERLGFLAQVFFMDTIPLEGRLAFMGRLEARYRAKVAALEEIEQGWRADDPRYPDDLPDEDFHAHLTLKLGLAKYRVIADWCADAMTAMERRAKRSR
ncbi:MAG: PadR family transcriptional regulator [Gemmatimonadota bacterium]